MFLLTKATSQAMVEGIRFTRLGTCPYSGQKAFCETSLYVIWGCLPAEWVHGCGNCAEIPSLPQGRLCFKKRKPIRPIQVSNKPAAKPNWSWAFSLLGIFTYPKNRTHSPPSKASPQKKQSSKKPHHHHDKTIPSSRNANPLQ